jgi:hypothetical protein
MLRFSLSWLLAAMALAGLAIATLNRPKGYLRGALALAVLGLLASAGTAAMLLSARRQPFGFGFAVFGALFLTTTAASSTSATSLPGWRSTTLCQATRRRLARNVLPFRENARLSVTTCALATTRIYGDGQFNLPAPAL